jgi:hypothetical protein
MKPALRHVFLTSFAKALSHLVSSRARVRVRSRFTVMLFPDGFGHWLSGLDPVADPGIDQAVSITPVSPKMN